MTGIDLTVYQQLFEELRVKYKTDLSNYAPASLERRLERFLHLHHFASPEALASALLSDSLLFDLFIKEITVNTTEMFRDPGCWKFMRDTVFPALKDLPGIRIWHAGCSSGEEVFSMAILLKEEGLLEKASLIATDLNKSIIETARKGTYHVKSLQVNEENYINGGGRAKLSDYYLLKDKHYTMDAELLKGVRFLKHDLSSGEAFSKFDLILCRNVMIYFNKELQERVFTLFKESLFKRGFLAIGKKESMAYYSQAFSFAEINPVEKIYRLK